MRGFEQTRVWVFDLDNTLYPATCNLFAQVDRRMGEFIARFLGVPFVYARHLQKTYYRQFGTTLSGLMQVHKIDPAPFLDYVHDIDVSVVPELPALANAIARLPGRRLIFTTGSRAHAERVTGKLGLLHLFDDIFDIVASGYLAKPQPAAYQRFLRNHVIDPTVSAMFEDMPVNLEPADSLGMTTVLVHARADCDHPAQNTIRNWASPPKYIHHMTDDLTQFLVNCRLEPCGSGDRDLNEPGRLASAGPCSNAMVT
jgi:putative hydrolase of the HAD superfamily